MKIKDTIRAMDLQRMAFLKMAVWANKVADQEYWFATFDDLTYQLDLLINDDPEMFQVWNIMEDNTILQKAVNRFPQ